MRVWRLEEGAELDRLLCDTRGQDYVCLSAAWVGPRLAYWRLKGVSSYAQFEAAISDPVRPSPYGDPAAFVRENSETWLWDPASGAHAVLLEEGSGLLVGDTQGRFLVVCEGTASSNTEFPERGRTTIVDVFSLEQVQRVAHRLADTGRRIHFPSQFTENLLLPYVYGEKQDGRFLLVGRLEAPLMPGDQVAVGVPALVSVSLDGNAVPFTNGSTKRLSSDPPGLPAAVRLGTTENAIACLLRKWRTNPYRLVCFGLDGRPVREYSFGLGWGVVEKATGQKTHWRPITVTPDGSHLLLQETAETGRVPLGEERWVWLWDLEHETGTRVARLPNIAACYGWIHNEHLLLQVTEGDRAMSRNAVVALHVEWLADLP